MLWRMFTLLEFVPDHVRMDFRSLIGVVVAFLDRFTNLFPPRQHHHCRHLQSLPPPPPPSSSSTWDDHNLHMAHDVMQINFDQLLELAGYWLS